MLLAPVHELDRRRAVAVGDRELTYRELREAAGALAARLRGAERVAVWADSSLETCVAVVAALSAGITLVPLNPKLGASELELIVYESIAYATQAMPLRLAARRSSPTGVR